MTISAKSFYTSILSTMTQFEKSLFLDRNGANVPARADFRRIFKAPSQKKMEGKGRPIADMDLAIASIAIHNQHILVTHTVKHF